MEILRSIAEWKKYRSSLIQESRDQSLGFVATMGALHEGHLSLVRLSMKENTRTAASIFLNPTQFNDPKDLENYPDTFSEDVRKLEAIGCDALFAPAYEELYPDNFRYKLMETEYSKILCGAHRPGHFDGVLTVVMKLLNIVQADRAYFGEKDWQQLYLIRGMADAFFMNTEIVGGPLIREPDGLAMSSRNLLLTADERKKAPLFNRIISGPGTIAEKEKALEDAGFTVDYIEAREGRILAAVFLGKVRLIDNVKG
jgi:pantoate--beta-alanine ligase